jgi:predicted kinase
VRKELHGVAPTETLPVDAYRPDGVRQVYAVVGARAAAAVDEDGGVIVDATAREPEERTALWTGLAGRGPIRAIVCEADLETLRRRATERQQDPERVSDAGPQVAVALAEAFDPPSVGVDGIVQAARLDTTRGTTVAAAATALDAELPCTRRHLAAPH